MNEPAPPPVISFIVPAYNEERLLARTLEALRAAGRASLLPFEVVVADDGSTDATASIASDHGAVLVKVAHRQIAATRNSGARAARGNLFMFVDADTVVCPAVVRAAADAMLDGAAGGGASVRIDGTLPRYARILLPAASWWLRTARIAAGCFIFCTREAFVAIGGFDEAYFGAEEIVLSRALRRHGRFVLLRHAVTTSGRKLRAHTGGEILRVVWRLAWRGKRGVRERRGLEIWYGERRHDPGESPAASRRLD